MNKSTTYWLTQSMADVPAEGLCLSSRERNILEKMRFPKRRNDWGLGRWTAKRAISVYVGNQYNWQEIEIIAAADGAPQAFLYGKPALINISISHSNGQGLCVIGCQSYAIGGDVEQIANRSDQFVNDYFTVEEQELVQQASPQDRCRMVTLIWSAKESALKSLRQGLRQDTRSIKVRLVNYGENQGWHPLLIECENSGRLFNGWWRQKGDCVLTVATDAPSSEPVELSLTNQVVIEPAKIGK